MSEHKKRLTVKQKRMRRAVEDLADFMATYDTQRGYVDYSDSILIDDVLYGLGVALEPDKYKWATGYALFKDVLRAHLKDKP